jgi:EmrB/QacA subfamily drug resistance transporter
MYLRDLPHSRKMSILAGVLLAMLLGALDATIVGPAMPSIVKDLGGMAMLSWVFIIYSLTSTITIPIVGKLSDLYGRKWFYLGGIGIFLAGSALSGAAGEPWLNSIFHSLTGADNAMLQLIIFRGVQGIGGGAMMANAMAIIGDLFSPRERGRYQGLTGGVFGLASVFGPMLGGWLTDASSWRWIFYINVPFGVLALVVLAYVMPRPQTGQQHQVDWWGATALATGLVPLLLALSWGGSQYGWGSPTIIGLLVAAAAALGVFCWVELRASEPILDLRLFKDSSFSASMLVLFLSGVGMYGTLMFLPTFMQVVLGSSASNSGALLTPMMISLIAGSILTGQLVSRTGRYKMFGVVGLGISAVGMFMLSRIGMETSSFTMALDMILVGFGIGVTMPLFTIALQSQFPTRIGEVTGAMQFFRSIGGTVGVALLGGVMNASLARELQSLVTAQKAAFGPAFATFAKLAEDPAVLLNAGAMQAIAAKMPPQMAPLLAKFATDLKQAVSVGITDAFFWGFVMMAIAFVGMWFVREIPLAGGPRLETAAEIGTELLVEESLMPAADEPVVVKGLTRSAEKAAGPDDAPGKNPHRQ